MADVLLFQTPDDGDITKSVETTNGLETALYVSLFGGNRDDDGSQDSTKSWWGNTIADKSEKMVSQTAYLLGTIPATAYGLGRIQEAAQLDLKWVTDTGTAQTVTVTVALVVRSKVHLTVQVDGVDYKFTEDWG